MYFIARQAKIYTLRDFGLTVRPPVLRAPRDPRKPCPWPNRFTGQADGLLDIDYSTHEGDPVE